MRLSLPLRPLAFVLVVVTLAGMTGCHWFKRGSAYQQSAENRPLEVPPDLDLPNTEGAMQPPEATHSVTRSAMATPAANQSGFTVQGERDAIFAKVGDSLAGIEGASIASKAQILGTYDVTYQGSNFLVRVTQVPAGVYVSAIDPRGTPATAEAPVKLIAALKAALGG
jgi:uncharacterized lipoprotein